MGFIVEFTALPNPDYPNIGELYVKVDDREELSSVELVADPPLYFRTEDMEIIARHLNNAIWEMDQHR